jgi:hypothetical protein
MEVGIQRHALTALPQGKTLDTQFKGGCVGPRACLNGCGDSHPTTGIRSPYRTLASRYIDYTIPAIGWPQSSNQYGINLKYKDVTNHTQSSDSVNGPACVY